MATIATIASQPCKILAECEAYALENVKIGLVAKIDETEVVRYFRNQPLKGAKKASKVKPTPTLCNRSDDADDAFDASESFHFQRNALFLAMLQKTAMEGKDPVTADQFNDCFQNS